MENQTHEHSINQEKRVHKRKRLLKNIWQVSTIFLSVVTIILLVMIFSGKSTGNVLSGDLAGKELVNYLNQQTNGGVVYISNVDKGNLYEVKIKYQNQEIPLYITKDGKYFVQGAVDITASEPSVSSPDNSAKQETVNNLPKSNKPKVELFVMTHCPYGTQSEKGIIPTVKALGNKIDFEIRFVHYFMHGDKEEKETYNQVCIREEQNAKYLFYLECFLEAGDSETCLKTASIDTVKLNTCLANDNKKAKEYYETDKKLSNDYGVQGSPTLIINGVEADSGRDSSSYLKTICGAFNNVPTAECTKQLSSASPSPGFGTTSSSATRESASSGGGCASA